MSRFQTLTNAMVERLARALPKRSYRSTAWDAAEQRPALHAESCTLTPAQDRLYRPTGEVGSSPWVRRCQSNDLPTFDRHNGAHAYRR